VVGMKKVALEVGTAAVTVAVVVARRRRGMKL
jgi:hypothetical protein